MYNKVLLSVPGERKGVYLRKANRCEHGFWNKAVKLLQYVVGRKSWQSSVALQLNTFVG